jgi:hypothetical protein
VAAAPAKPPVARPAPSAAPADQAPRTPAPAAPAPSAAGAALKDALLAEIRGGKTFFYNTVIAQAQSIECTSDKVTFAFLPTHRALRDQLEQNRAWLEAAAERVAGRKMAVTSVQVDAAGAPANGAKPEVPADAPPNGKRDLKAEALSSATVQAVLDVFPGEIKDVEELK